MRERKPSCEIGKERGFCKCWDEGKTTGHPESGRNWGGEGGIGEGRDEGVYTSLAEALQCVS